MSLLQQLPDNINDLNVGDELYVRVRVSRKDNTGLPIFLGTADNSRAIGWISQRTFDKLRPEGSWYKKQPSFEKEAVLEQLKKLQQEVDTLKEKLENM